MSYDNGFKVVADKYFRGNGRWAKVARLHTPIGQIVNGRQQWKRKYSVAVGYKDQFKACQEPTHYAKRVTAESVAKDWIEYHS